MPMHSECDPAVTVIIPCRNEAGSIRACMDSILAQESPEGGYEVIVVDGMSEDATREILREYEGARNGGPEVRVLRNRGRIVSTGLNLAIRAARGSIIVRIDSHTEYAKDYVRQCVACLERTGATNVGGPARTKAQGRMQRAVAAAYHSPFAVGGARFHDVEFEGSVDTVTYGCWRKTAFEEHGYFDEDLVRNQDDEHNLRITRNGGTVWQSPEIRSWYSPRSSLTALFRQYMQYGYWKVRVIQKHRIPASVRHLIPGAFVLCLLLSAGAALGCGLSSLVTYWMTGTGPDPLLSVVGWVSGGILAAALLSYSLAVGLASFVTASRKGWDLLPALPLVFPCYHLAYGWGFLRGALDFIVLGRRPGVAFTSLSRRAAN